MPRLDPAFFARGGVAVAKALVGTHLTIRGVGGRIVETEAYCREDPASHSFHGQTRRNAAMFGPSGTAYVYQSYGIHWCLNVVCIAGDAVLLRALEPLVGLDMMAARRRSAMAANLCSGPGKIGQALEVGPQDNGRSFQLDDFCIERGLTLTCDEILSGPRIGISRATAENWRFALRGSAFLSRKF